MVYSEKIATAVTRGTVNTRWRDFADMYLLARRHPVDGTQLRHSVHEVARHAGAPETVSADAYHFRGR
jgi:Nucleotidyl transferase AbiEii toxin, Type IV TA system